MDPTSAELPSDAQAEDVEDLEPAEDDGAELDPAMLQAMGFSGFGMQSKPSSYKSKDRLVTTASSITPSPAAPTPRSNKRQKLSNQSSATGANEIPLSTRVAATAASAQGRVAEVGEVSEETRADGKGYDERHPPRIRRMSNGEEAFFMDSFIVEDPWEGMVGKPLVGKEKGWRGR